MIDFKHYEQAIKQAEAERKEAQKHVAEARAENRVALEELEALKGELEALAAIIASYEGDAPTTVTPEQFEQAIMQQRVLGPQLRRAEAKQRRTSEAWQDAERKATSLHRGKQRAILAEFDEDARRVRDQFYQQLQAMF